MAADVNVLTRTPMRQVVRPPSLTSMVAGQIRELIITDQLAMGEQLSENKLAQRLGVSRTPIREACLQLQSERLVEVRPQRGIFVFTCDAGDIRDLCEMREVIETACLRLGMRRNPAGMLDGLQAGLADCQAVMDEPGKYQVADHDFHCAFVAASDNHELILAYDAVSGRSRALRYRYSRTMQEVRNSQEDHEKIVDLLGGGEGEAAEKVLSGHVYGSLRNVERILERISG